MSVPVTNIGTGLYDQLYSTYNIRKVNQFINALNLIVPLLKKNYFKDSAKIFIVGLPKLNTLFATQGITSVPAAQNFASLLYIASLPSATGMVFPNRGDYLYYLASDLSYILSPDQALTASLLGIDFSGQQTLPSGDTLAYVGNYLANFRASNPINFSPLAKSIALTHFLDNIAAFDAFRIYSQQILPASKPPTPIVCVNTVNTGAVIGPVTMNGFGVAQLGYDGDSVSG